LCYIFVTNEYGSLTPVFVLLARAGIFNGKSSSSPRLIAADGEFVVERRPASGENWMTKTKKPEFRPNEFVVYPAHGVGRIILIEEQEIAGLKLELFVISFEKDKMTLRVPTHKATEIGMRQLSSPDVVTKALDTLKGKAKVKRAMWSRRAQEYEQKINSGDLLSIAEVVRDLHRTDDQREQSYSERQLYEAALERLTREVAAVSGVDEAGAAKKVDDVLVSRAA
jgi:CarD family transcriptional regulator